MEKPKYDGVSINMGGEKYIVPALSLRQMKKYAEQLMSLGTVTISNFVEKLDVALPVIQAAINRNYPDITQDELLDLIDLNNFRSIIEAINASSGLREAKPGEQQPVREPSIGPQSSVQ